MLQPGNWLAFTAASALVAVLPGPGVANIVGYAVNSGCRTAFAAIAGRGGRFSRMTVSLAGADAERARAKPSHQKMFTEGRAALGPYIAAVVTTRSRARRRSSLILPPVRRLGIRRVTASTSWKAKAGACW